MIETPTTIPSQAKPRGRLAARPRRFTRIIHNPIKPNAIPKRTTSCAVWINREKIPGDQAYGPYDELPDLTGLPALLGIDGAGANVEVPAGADGRALPVS